MATTVHSARLNSLHSNLLIRQARRRNTEPSALSALYLAEKTIEEEFPGVGFRDAASGREACLVGHRIAVWEVQDAHQELRSIEKTAGHFRVPAAIIRSALSYAKEYATSVATDRSAEVASA